MAMHRFIDGEDRMQQTLLPNSLGEFDFRYNQRISLGVNDDQRMAKAAKGIVGKRLTYRRLVGPKKPRRTSRSKRKKLRLPPPAPDPPRQLGFAFMSFPRAVPSNSASTD